MPLRMPDDVIPLPHESLHSHSSKAAGLPQSNGSRETETERQRKSLN